MLIYQGDDNTLRRHVSAYFWVNRDKLLTDLISDIYHETSHCKLELLSRIYITKCIEISIHAIYDHFTCMAL